MTRWLNRLMVVGVGFACLGSILQTLVPTPVFLALIGVSLACTATGLIIVHVKWREIHNPKEHP